MEVPISSSDENLIDMKKYFSKNHNSEEILAHTGKVQTVNWNCDGKKLASGSADKSISIFSFDRERLKKESTLKDHTEVINQLIWHPSDEDILASASSDKTVKIWDTRNPQPITTIQTSGENINITWSPDGQTIAVGNKDDVISFIETKTWTIIREEPFKHEINEISWNNSNDLFFVTSGLGSIVILSYPDLKILKSIQAHPSNCISLDFDPTGNYFAVGSADALVSIWNADDLICTGIIPRLDWPIRSLRFSYDGMLIASASEDSFIDIALTQTGEQIYELPSPDSTFSLAWHPSKYILAYSCGSREKSDKDSGSVRVFGLPLTNQ